MTKPLDPQSLARRKMIRDAKACGYDLLIVWEGTDGQFSKLVFKRDDKEETEPEEADSWEDVK